MDLHGEGRGAGRAEGRGGVGQARRQETSGAWGGAQGCRRDQQEGPLGSKKQAGPWVEGADRLCTHESLERSRAGDQRSPLDLRKVRDSTGASGKETSLPGRDGGLRDCKQECCCDGGMVQLHGPLLLRNFGLAVKRESQAEP